MSNGNKGWSSQVMEFTQATGRELSKTPIKLNPEAVEFISRMVCDELGELAEATDITEQADALVDAIYYILDTASKHGMALDVIFDMVHGANLAKKNPDGTYTVREDGKVMKPEGWVAPDDAIRIEIERQAGFRKI